MSHYYAIFTVKIGADQHTHEKARHIADQLAKTLEHQRTTDLSGGLSLHHELQGAHVVAEDRLRSDQ